MNHLRIPDYVVMYHEHLREEIKKQGFNEVEASSLEYLMFTNVNQEFRGYLKLSQITDPLDKIGYEIDQKRIEDVTLSISDAKKHIQSCDQCREGYDYFIERMKNPIKALHDEGLSDQIQNRFLMESRYFLRK